MSRAPTGAKLHLGCGTRAPAGWTNVDGAIGARLARLAPWRWLQRHLGWVDLDWPSDLTIHDLRKPFPWRDGSAQCIYSSHTLEHLDREQGRRFLNECARVLAPGGVLRIVVPDLAVFLGRLEKGELRAVELLDQLDVQTSRASDPWWKALLAPYFRFPHRCMYDTACLIDAFAEAGLQGEAALPFVSGIADIDAVETAERTRDSVIVEAQKPSAN
ncbi:MAG: methyltransferase domain-containing protein [Myxococcota bacterium]